jgi:hypothetical protein
VLDTWGMEREHPWLPITEAIHIPSHSHTTVGADGSVMDTQGMEREPPDFRRNPYPESSPYYRRRRR